ncbi:hypothetical protein VPH35_106377 [Triticum aestivum]
MISVGTSDALEPFCQLRTTWGTVSGMYFSVTSHFILSLGVSVILFFYCLHTSMILWATIISFACHPSNKLWLFCMIYKCQTNITQQHIFCWCGFSFGPFLPLYL